MLRLAISISYATFKRRAAGGKRVVPSGVVSVDAGNQAAAAPEPASLAVLSAGTLLLTRRRRLIASRWLVQAAIVTVAAGLVMWLGFAVREALGFASCEALRAVRRSAA